MEYEKLKQMKLDSIKEICKQKHIKYHNKKKSELINILININNNTDNNIDYNSFSINEEPSRKVKVLRCKCNAC